MARPKFRKITVELVVEASEVPEVKKLLGEALDTIHEENTLVTQKITDEPARRPAEADEYGYE